jgi:hypothetical protein
LIRKQALLCSVSLMLLFPIPHAVRQNQRPKDCCENATQAENILSERLERLKRQQMLAFFAFTITTPRTTV